MLKKIFKYSFYPGLILSALIITWSLRVNEAIDIKYMFLILVVANGIIWAFEFIYPYHLEWRPDKKTLKLDILYSLSAAILITPLLKLMLFKLYTSFDWNFLNIWPKDWPVAIQLLLAIVYADFFIYWFHRWCHLHDSGWRLHVIHHTPSKLHFWASARTHPFNLFIFYTTEVGVLVFLGIGNDVLALWTLFLGINGQFQHCNIDIKPGIFNWFFQTCATHRVHHSPNWKYSNSNFGNQTVVWDHIFGTYYLPKEDIKETGIKMHKIPESYIEQLKIPFNLEKYKV